MMVGTAKVLISGGDEIGESTSETQRLKFGVG